MYVCTNGRMDGRMDGDLRPALIGRLSRVDLNIEIITVIIMVRLSPSNAAITTSYEHITEQHTVRQDTCYNGTQRTMHSY